MISKELREFIIDFFSEKNIYIDTELLTSETEIYYDLNIHDLDVDLFMGTFLKKFDIDDTDFDSKKYFGLGIPIIDNNVKSIKEIVGNRKCLPLEKEKREPFTLGLLDKAIRTKKLL